MPHLCGTLGKCRVICISYLCGTLRQSMSVCIAYLCGTLRQCGSMYIFTLTVFVCTMEAYVFCVRGSVVAYLRRGYVYL